MGLAKCRMGPKEEEQSEIVKISAVSQISLRPFVDETQLRQRCVERHSSNSLWALEGLMTVEYCFCSPTIWRSGGRVGDVWRHIGHIQRMHTRTLQCSDPEGQKYQTVCIIPTEQAWRHEVDVSN